VGALPQLQGAHLEQLGGGGRSRRSPY
jgi:hypothetical protein